MFKVGDKNEKMMRDVKRNSELETLGDKKEKIMRDVKRNSELETLSDSSQNPSFLNFQHHSLSPSSSFSNGFSSPFQDQQQQQQAKFNGYGLWLGSKSLPDFHLGNQNVNGKNLAADGFDLCENLRQMHVRDVDGDGFSGMRRSESGPDGFGFCFPDDVSSYNAEKYSPHQGFNKGYFQCFDGNDVMMRSTSLGLPTGNEKADSLGSKSSWYNNQRDYPKSSWYNNQRDYPKSSWYNNQRDYLLEQRMEQYMSNRPYLDNPFAYSKQCGMDGNGNGGGGRGVIDSTLFLHSKIPLVEDHIHDSYKCCKKKSVNLKEKSSKLDQNLQGENARLMSSSYSLAEFRGCITYMAKDQNHCRFLQRIFDEGSCLEVQIIFNEIIDDIVELMMDPFGNYLVQKLLDVCTEEQRLQIVLMVTKDGGQLVRISLNTYGTRVVQKLIETLRSRQQILLIKSALKPGILDLIKDLNGNHVLQRCLQCLDNEDNKGLLGPSKENYMVTYLGGLYPMAGYLCLEACLGFDATHLIGDVLGTFCVYYETSIIFDAAAQFCVDIATHRHGCCVLQRCISHSSGQHRDNLITQISRNGLLLAQDPFGNYVVQYIIELKVPSAVVNLLSQFKGHYVQLSMQKFSSHVVEKCLKNYAESRSQIIQELISVVHFEQLLQDPYANYVIQSALAVTKGPLHATLVGAVRPHMILRTSPYCKRIFSWNLLKK